MMRGINKVILVGNVGKEPDLKTLQEEVPVVKFSLATTESFRDKHGQEVSRTQWHTIIAWRSLAGLAKAYLRKGSHVYIEGKLNHRQYEDKGGNKRWVTEIFADQLVLLDKRAISITETTVATDENLPF